MMQSTTSAGTERYLAVFTREVALIGMLWCSLAIPASAGEADLDSVPLPPGAVIRIVALDSVQNGRRVSIATLESAQSIEETLSFYRQAWAEPRGTLPGHIEETAGDWQIISRLEDPLNLVVQLRNGKSGVEGFISALSIEPVATPGNLPLPSGGELLSSTSTQDGPLHATTSVVASIARTGQVAAFYRDRLARKGWKLASDRSELGSRVLLLQRRGARMELVVADDEQGGSITVLNEVHEK